MNEELPLETPTVRQLPALGQAACSTTVEEYQGSADQQLKTKVRAQ
jgi:hypothetical protein